MTLAATLLAAALVVPSMPPPEFDDYEVITNCVFDASRQDAKEFAVRIELDATPSNGVEVVFGRDADGDGILSRTEETMSVSGKRHSCRFPWSRQARPSPEESGESAASPRPSRPILVGIALLAIVCTLCGGGFERVVRRWVWYGAKPRETVTLSVRYRMKGDSTALKPFLPGCEFMLMGVDW